MKGIEGLPLKYMAMLLMSMLVIAAFVHIASILATTGFQGVSQSNQTLNEILNKSIGNVLQQNSTAG